VKGMQYLQNHFHLKPNDIIVTHDAARINVSNKIIFDNITTASKQGYASTVLALHDSIIKLDKQASYLERSHKYIVQTPQTFQYKY
jgi:2-C-methyl-D-erythritol 4-phosphate cytidylyltransferase